MSTIDWKDYPEPVREFIRLNSEGCNRTQMALLLNQKFPEFAPFLPEHIAAFRKKHHIMSHAFRNKYPFGLLDFVKSVADGRTRKEIHQMIVEKFGDVMTVRQVNFYLKNNRIRTNVPTGFQKGCKSSYHPPKTAEAAERAKRVRFKPGHVPANWRPVGSIRVEKNGQVQIKVQNTGRSRDRWKGAARVIWERAHGPIPAGHLIAYVDGDSTNVNLSNLRLIPVKDYWIFYNLPSTKTAEQMDSKLALVELTKARRAAIERLRGKK